MDMYQKREQRKNKKNGQSNNEEKKQAMIHINWYPGHMTKAKREMQEKLKMVDLVIELRDARIPAASKNPLIDELCANKPRLIILSKKDKAQENETTAWMNKLHSEQVQVLALDIPKENITPIVIKAAQLLMKDMIARQVRKGINPRALRAMVVGVPNVGKSTFINKIVKKKIAQTGDRPGVTRALQWTKVNDKLELLDTPGVLWPKFEDAQVGLLLAVCGSIKDEILPIEEVAAWAMKTLCKTAPELVKTRYQVDISENPFEMFERIAKARGFLLGNAQYDIKRSISTFLKELRGDKLGRITWEKAYADCE